MVLIPGPHIYSWLSLYLYRDKTFVGHYFNFYRVIQSRFLSSALLIIRFAHGDYHTHIYTPDVSGQVPCMRPNIFPHALDTAAIFARTGRLWITNETSLRCCFANVCAWPRMPKPVMSVAA